MEGCLIPPPAGSTGSSRGGFPPSFLKFKNLKGKLYFRKRGGNIERSTPHKESVNKKINIRSGMERGLCLLIEKTNSAKFDKLNL
jgi:hypothetical protein